MKLRGLVPNLYNHVSVSDLFILKISPRQTDPWNICINRTQVNECGNWVTEPYNSVLEITRLRSFIFWEYINQNQTFILGSHRHIICCEDNPEIYAP